MEPAAGRPASAGRRVLAHQPHAPPTGATVASVEVRTERIIDDLGPVLALQQRKQFRRDTVLIVDGTADELRQGMPVTIDPQPAPERTPVASRTP